MNSVSRRKSTPATPPEKGSFPIDHKSACTPFYESYMICLEQNERISRFCANSAKEYLQCRIDNNLMQNENVDEIGFFDVKKEFQN